MGKLWERNRCGRLWWASLCVRSWRGKQARLRLSALHYSTIITWYWRRDIASELLLFALKRITARVLSVLYDESTVWYYVWDNNLILNVSHGSALFSTHSKLRFRETMSGPDLSARWQRSTRTETMPRSWQLSAWPREVHATDRRFKGPAYASLPTPKPHPTLQWPEKKRW